MMRKVLLSVYKLAKKPFTILKKAYRLLVPPYLTYVKDINFRRRASYGLFFDRYKVDENLILYEAYHGRSFTCNPYAIYKHLINDPKYKKFKHVWVVDDYNNPSIKLFKNNPNTTFVKIHSRKYLKMLAKAKYLINNTSFGFYFHKKKEQIYINTWHGTPLKTLGKDVESANISDHKNIQRNFLHADYFVSPNKFTTDTFLKSLDIHGIFNGEVLDIGYPRIDLTLNTNSDHIRSLLNIPKDKKIILYAPTWRGSSVNSAVDLTEKLLEDVNTLNERFGNQYVVLLKVHMFVYKYLKEHGKEDLCVPNWIDTNELLSAVDILITDYSSIFFDFLPTKKPIIFYMFDRKAYELERGFYINLDDLPGPICESIENVISVIHNLPTIQKEFESKYNNFVNTYSYKDDGNATKRLISVIFENLTLDHESQYKVKNNKKKILMYSGGFYNNGITVSALSLAKYLDYEKYDLTMIDFDNKNLEATKNIKKLDPRVRVIYRAGAFNMRILESIRHYFVIRKGLYKNWVKKIAPINTYKKELRRIIGQTDFDIVIDFGGYNAFWTLLFAFSDIPRKGVFLHSDMYEEYNKKINGEFKHQKNLRLIFSLYNHFDKVVSVTKSANDSNKQKLKHLIDNHDEKMVYVNNAIDYLGILELKDKDKKFNYNDNEYIVVEEIDDFYTVSPKGVLSPKKEDINFVNIGRLSPEKDQTKLILAFKQAVEQHPDKSLKLYIIGSGPLEKELKKLALSLGLKNKVIFTGHISNPYVIMNKCDCLVFSSNYEGQGLAVLESLVLGKPVIATNVTGVKSILENYQGGLLVENSVEGLVSGLNKFLTSEIETKPFDYKAYNEEAMSMYYEKIFY